MFYRKRIEALEERVAVLERKVAGLLESSRVQHNEISMLWSQFAGPQQTEPKTEPKPRRRRRKNNGKEKTTATE